MKDVLEKIADEMNHRNDIPMTDELRAAFSGLENLSWMDKDEEDVLLGKVLIFKVPHHVTFIRVVYDEKLMMLRATRDPYDRLEDIYARITEGVPQTVNVPGFEGDWVVSVEPYT